MPGLVPGIHAAPRGRVRRLLQIAIERRDGSAWMAGTSPAMTVYRASISRAA